MQRSREEWIEIFSQNADRFHVPIGTPAYEYDSGKELGLYFRSWFPEGGNMVDIGCGSGRCALGLTDYDARYFGVDCHKNSIDFCQSIFKPWDNITFEWMDVQNDLYNPHGKISPREVKLPFEDHSSQFVISGSLFTHFDSLQTCENYIAEIGRILERGSYFFSTWFRSPPNTLNTPNADGARSVFREKDILNMLGTLFEVVECENGETMEQHDQWTLKCKKK